MVQARKTGFFATAFSGLESGRASIDSEFSPEHFGRNSPQSWRSGSRPLSRAKCTSAGAAGAGPMRRRYYQVEILGESCEEDHDAEFDPLAGGTSQAESEIREARRQKKAGIFRTVKAFPGLLEIRRGNKKKSDRRAAYGEGDIAAGMQVVPDVSNLHTMVHGCNVVTTGFCHGFDHSTCTVKSKNRNADISTLEATNRVTRLRVRATKKAEISRLPPFRSNTPRPHLCDRSPSLFNTPYVDPRPLSPRGPSPPLIRSPSPQRSSPAPFKHIVNQCESKPKGHLLLAPRKTFGALRSGGLFTEARNSGYHQDLLRGFWADDQESEASNTPSPGPPVRPASRSSYIDQGQIFLADDESPGDAHSMKLDMAVAKANTDSFASGETLAESQVPERHLAHVVKESKEQTSTGSDELQGQRPALANHTDSAENTATSEGAKAGLIGTLQLPNSQTQTRSSSSRPNSPSQGRPRSPKDPGFIDPVPGHENTLSRNASSRTNMHSPTMSPSASFVGRPNSPGTLKRTSRTRKGQDMKNKATFEPSEADSKMLHAPEESLKFLKKRPKVQQLLNNIYRLKSNVGDRLRKIDAARQHKANKEAAIKEAGTTEEELHHLREAFSRYHQGVTTTRELQMKPELQTISVPGEISSDDFFEALADLGMKPRSRTEKQQVFALIDEFDDGNGAIDFLEFVQIAHQVRTKMVEANRSAHFQAFLQFEDKESTGIISVDDIPKMLEAVGVKALTEYEAELIRAVARETDADGSGEVDFTEFEGAVQTARERLHADRRSEERRIRDQHEISQAYFEEFRHEMIRQYTTFKNHVHAYDEDFAQEESEHEEETMSPATTPAKADPPIRRRTQGPFGKPRLVDVDDLCMLLADIGITPRSPEETKIMEEVVEEFIQDERSGEIDFKCYLMFLKVIRQKMCDFNAAQLEVLFKQYDRDDSGELSMREVSSILLDLGLQPRSQEERDEIQAMMEDADSDGSNEINFDEFCVLFQHISEKIQALQRDAERLKAEELGFTKGQLQELRRAFEALDEDSTGGLTIAEIRTGLHLMRRELGPSQLRDQFEALDADKTGELDFTSFIMMMRFIEDNAPKSKFVPAPSGGNANVDQEVAKAKAKQARATAVIAQIANPEPEPMPLSRHGRRVANVMT